jgi:predicted nucleic acid-binding protein
MAAKTCSDKYIPDASVLIKWFVHEEEDAKQAAALEKDAKSSTVTLIIPALTSWELCNYLGRKFDALKASSLFGLFKNYKLPERFLTLKETSLAFHLMQKHHSVSFYEASYHALAISENATFLTCDKKYYEKTKRLGHIKLLKDY